VNGEVTAAMTRHHRLAERLTGRNARSVIGYVVLGVDRRVPASDQRREERAIAAAREHRPGIGDWTAMATSHRASRGERSTIEAIEA
jgi:hypothetical protein